MTQSYQPPVMPADYFDWLPKLGFEPNAHLIELVKALNKRRVVIKGRTLGPSVYLSKGRQAGLTTAVNRMVNKKTLIAIAVRKALMSEPTTSPLGLTVDVQTVTKLESIVVALTTHISASLQQMQNEEQAAQWLAQSAHIVGTGIPASLAQSFGSVAQKLQQTTALVQQMRREQSQGLDIKQRLNELYLLVLSEQEAIH